MSIGMRLAVALAAMALAMPAALAQSAQPAASVDDLAARFGALEAVQHVSLSPDGTHLAYVVPQVGGGQRLLVVDLANGGVPRAVLSEANRQEQLTSCNWGSDTRLICRLYVIYDDAGTLLGFTRLLAVNADGSNLAMLSRDGDTRSKGYTQDGGAVIDWSVPDAPGHVLLARTFVPEGMIGSVIEKRDEGYGVEDLDVTTMKRKLVERARREAKEYIADGLGTVRIMGTRGLDSTNRLQDRITYQYRKQGSRDWNDLSVLQLDGIGNSTGFNPYAVDPARNVAIGFDDHNGRSALVSMALDGTAAKQVLLSRADVDVDGLVRIGRNRRVVGASYATERRQIEFFDPALSKLSGALQRALPGKPAVDFVDSSADESKLLLLASSDTNPGTFYLFDKATKKLGEVLPVRPELAGLAAGTMTPITYPAADGTSIPGYLTLPPGSSGKGLPAIVMPHGGPSARDEWGFDWLAQFFVARGFAVLQPNYRGSSGYGADFYMKNGFQSWRTAVGDVNDAGRWLLAQGIAAPGKLAIVGWSYGGYAALQGAVIDPALYKAVVAVAPVTDFEMLRQEADKYTSGKLVSRFIGTGPHVREGSPLRNAEKITVPVLLFHGDKDQNVGIDESKAMANRLKALNKPVDLVLFPGLAHSLTDSTARATLLKRSDAFLRKAMDLP